MNSIHHLPNGYINFLEIDMENDIKTLKLLCFYSIGLFVVMVLPTLFLIPLSETFIGGIKQVLIKIALIVVLSCLYIIIHELIHGIFIRIFTNEKAHYGFLIKFAYAGSDLYIKKMHYIIIALSPVIILGLLLLFLNIALPSSWFWVIFSIQILNISGSVGDFYVTFKIYALPSSVLIKDLGTKVTIYKNNG